MKKFLCGVAIVLASVSLTACGGDKEKSGKEKETTSTQASTEQTTTSSASVSQESSTTNNTSADNSTEKIATWETKAMESLSLKPLEIKDVLTEDNIKFKVATTPFDFSVEEIKNKLNSNQFINDNYVMAVSYGDSADGADYEDVGIKFTYHIYDSVCGVSKAKSEEGTKYFADFSIAFNRDTYLYTNYDRIYISFENLKNDAEVQKNVHSVIADALGQEYADYMVYAKDVDGKNYDGSSLENEMEASEIIETDSGSYLFNRNYYKSSDGSIDVSFTLSVYDSGIKDRFLYYNGGYTSVSEKLPYTFESMITGDVGNRNYKQFNTLCDKYMKLGYNVYDKTLFNDMNSEYLVADNGVKITEYKLTCLKGSEEYASFVAPELDIDYKICEDDNGIYYVEYNITGGAGHINKENNSIDASYTKIVEVQKQQVNCLFPQLNLDDVSYETIKQSNSKSISKDVVINVNGVDLKGKITFTIGDSAEVIGTYTGLYKIELAFEK